MNKNNFSFLFYFYIYLRFSFFSCFDTIEDACTLQFRDLSLACSQALRVPSYAPVAGDSCLYIDAAPRRHLDALALLTAVAVAAASFALVK
jgi:hypothetical protein